MNVLYKKSPVPIFYQKIFFKMIFLHHQKLYIYHFYQKTTLHPIFCIKSSLASEIMHQKLRFVSIFHSNRIFCTKIFHSIRIFYKKFLLTPKISLHSKFLHQNLPKNSNTLTKQSKIQPHHLQQQEKINSPNLNHFSPQIETTTVNYSRSSLIPPFIVPNSIAAF